MKLLFALVILSALGTAAFAQPSEHTNPPLRCGDLYEWKANFSLFQQYPLESPGERSAAELLAFCDRIEAEFSRSGLSPKEADTLYSVLDDLLHVSDESVGFPVAGRSPPPVVFRERVALSERGANEYGVYFWKTGCGISYFLYHATLHPDGSAEVEKQERWRAIYPC